MIRSGYTRGMSEKKLAYLTIVVRNQAQISLVRKGFKI